MLTFVLTGFSLRQSAAPAKAAAGDRYEPLRLYDGYCQADVGGKEPMRISNHCEKTVVFFVCEQNVDGKSEDLVIFLRVGTSDSGQKYRTMSLRVKHQQAGRLGRPGNFRRPLGVLESGFRERHESRLAHDQRVFRHKIHFDVQRSADGKTWETQHSGDERRLE